MQPHLSNEFEPPGRALPPIPLALPGVQVTPVTVSHFGADRNPHNLAEKSYGCASFVVETAVTKSVLLWDIDSENHWLTHPTTPEQAAAVQLLSNADYLFIDTAFWQAKDKPATHPSFTNVQRYVKVLQPRQTLLVHLSGHPDGRGNPGWGWDNGRWQAEAQKVWAEKGLSGYVHVPAIGQQFDI